MKKLLIFIIFSGNLLNSWSQNCDTNLFPNGQQYYDLYRDVERDMPNWKHYNTHDPTVYKDDEWFYMYSTDASMGNIHNTGALKRRSKDLVNWEFLGTAFDGVPQSAVDFFLNNGNPNYTDQGIWAPFLYKFKNKYYLYYSAPGGLSVNFAYIGYAISDSANGPWIDQGMITTSYGDTINAIDPTVVYDSINQRLWLAYGSWHNGIYMLELDTATGGLKNPGDRGFKIAARTGGLEGAEINYRNGWYYLFVSYDPLGVLYNVRVGRSRNVNGPYYDFNGVDMAETTSNIPMIQSPYRFNNHPGWQGTAHCGVYNDNGTYYMFNQGRPTIEDFEMILHVRKIFWMDDWPIVSPERYAGVPQCSINADSLIGEWEHMPLIYKTSLSSPHSTSQSLEMYANGTFNNNTANTWTFNNDTLILNWNNNQYIDKLIVFWGWDWENSCRTLLYTGMNTDGLCIWGKKINQNMVDAYNKIVTGGAYLIRNQYSNMFMEVPVGNDNIGASIKQGVKNGEKYQLWRILDARDGYYKFKSLASDSVRIIEIANGHNTNGADIILGINDDTEKHKFRIYNNNNGYFRILSKVSDETKSFDVQGFSISHGGNIFQWDYLHGLNQAWRFKRIDSLGIDTIGTYTPIIIENIDYGFTNSDNYIKIYPNPSMDGNFKIDFDEINSYNQLLITIFDNRGGIVFKSIKKSNQIEQFDINLSSGIYVVQINSGKSTYLKKMVVF